MKIITSILCIILFSACYGPKIASRQIDRAHSEQEQILASKCGYFYPVKDSLLPAQVISRTDTFYSPTDTLWIECPDIKSEGSKLSHEIRIPVKCPPQIIIRQVDTIRQIVYKENTATLRASNLERDKYKASAATWRSWAIICGILAVILAIFIGLFITHKNKA